MKVFLFFTDVLLESFKTDTLLNHYAYTSVWRNTSTEHFYAPYPEHSSVPDFLDYYDDPYTYFEQDLPEIYQLLEADDIPP